MPGAGETPVADLKAQSGPDSLVSATVWVEGQRPKPGGPDGGMATSGIRWFDVSPGASLEGLLELLEPRCEGLEPEMLQDLLALDDLPQGDRWDGGSIRLASTFGIYPKDGDCGADWALSDPSPDALYQPVELVAGADWLITIWHDPCLYCGSALAEPLDTPIGKAELIDSVAGRWSTSGARNAGDLGVLVMHELALTYVPAHRAFRAALEDWEMNLYGFGDDGRQTSFDPEGELRDLWGARARLREWLTPLNVSGLNGDLGKAWLPAADHATVKDMDRHVDMTLDGLRQLGDTLRSSFQLLHIQKSEAQREHRERLQRRVERIATVFLVPTLVVGFFGANTWIPGEHKQAGLEGMVVVMVAATAIVMLVLWLTQKRHEAEHVEWPGRAAPPR